MKRLLIFALLTGCASLQGANVHKDMEKVDITANLTYTAIANSVNEYEALPTTTPAQHTSAEAIKVTAWNVLMAERAAYTAGDAALQNAKATALTDLKGTAP